MSRLLLRGSWHYMIANEYTYEQIVIHNEFCLLIFFSINCRGKIVTEGWNERLKYSTNVVTDGKSSVQWETIFEQPCWKSSLMTLSWVPALKGLLSKCWTMVNKKLNNDLQWLTLVTMVIRGEPNSSEVVRCSIVWICVNRVNLWRSGFSALV